MCAFMYGYQGLVLECRIKDQTFVGSNPGGAEIWLPDFHNQHDGYKYLIYDTHGSSSSSYAKTKTTPHCFVIILIEGILTFTILFN